MVYTQSDIRLPFLSAWFYVIDNFSFVLDIHEQSSVSHGIISLDFI